MSEIFYLELAEIIEIHAQLLDLYGGLAGFKEKGAVESATFRPRNKALYDEANLQTQAAALYFGLAKNHGFSDGNKRIALAATDVFLQLNGWKFTCDQPTLQRFTQRCDEEGWTERHVAEFVERHSWPLQPSPLIIEAHPL
jgi:death-on-curing protein